MIKRLTTVGKGKSGGPSGRGGCSVSSWTCCAALGGLGPSWVWSGARGSSCSFSPFLNMEVHIRHRPQPVTRICCEIQPDLWALHWWVFLPHSKGKKASRKWTRAPFLKQLGDAGSGNTPKDKDPKTSHLSHSQSPQVWHRPAPVCSSLAALL